MKNEQESQRLQGLKHTDVQLWRQVKAAAVMEGKTMTQWVEEVLRKHLAATEKSNKRGK